MTTTRSIPLAVLLSIPLLAGLGSTGAQAYDPRVTTRPSDLMEGGSAPVVRDHRRPGPIVRDHRGPNGAPQGGVIVTSSPRQRGSTPCVRSIFGGPCVGLSWR